MYTEKKYSKEFLLEYEEERFTVLLRQKKSKLMLEEDIMSKNNF